MSDKKTEIETLIRFDKPIEKREDTNQVKQKNSREVLKEILVNQNLNGENSSPDIDTLLNIMIPPLEFEQDEKKFIQYVSHSSSAREDVINL